MKGKAELLPNYEHTQKGSKLIYWIALFMLLELLVIEAIIYLVGTRTADPLPGGQLVTIMLMILAIHSVVFGWAFLMMCSLTVTVDNTFVRLRFGPGMWKKKIALDHITAAEPVRNTFSNGWGIHYIGNRCWLYNIAGTEAVEVTLKNGRKTRIGTDEPDRLTAAIMESI